LTNSPKASARRQPEPERARIPITTFLVVRGLLVAELCDLIEQRKALGNFRPTT
jgi:hypothetical protein